MPTIAIIGFDIGKCSLHVVGLYQRGAIVLRQKWSRGKCKRFADTPPCLIGMGACVGPHHLSRQLKGLGHDARLMPAKYVRPYSKGQKNDFRDAEAIAKGAVPKIGIRHVRGRHWRGASSSVAPDPISRESEQCKLRFSQLVDAPHYTQARQCYQA